MTSKFLSKSEISEIKLQNYYNLDADNTTKIQWTDLDFAFL